jgi:hypothetical protein
VPERAKTLAVDEVEAHEGLDTTINQDRLVGVVEADSLSFTKKIVMLLRANGTEQRFIVHIDFSGNEQLHGFTQFGNRQPTSSGRGSLTSRESGRGGPVFARQDVPVAAVMMTSSIARPMPLRR